MTCFPDLPYLPKSIVKTRKNVFIKPRLQGLMGGGGMQNIKLPLIK